MLIDLRVTNFRSIREQQVFSMVAGTRPEWRETHTFDTGIDGLPRLLNSAALYGANAAGKTTLMRALLFVQQWVIHSSKNTQQGQKIGTTPFLFHRAWRDKPCEFEVNFIEEGVRYQYGFSADETRIHREWLIAYPQRRPQRWFDREFDVETGTYNWAFGSRARGSYTLWSELTRENALFLSTAIMLNSQQLKPVFNWFQQKLVLVAAGVQLNPGLTFDKLGTDEGKGHVMQFLQAADLDIDDLMLRREPILPGSPLPANRYIETKPENPMPTLVQVLSMHRSSDTGELVPLDMAEESEGTRRLFESAGAWLKVIEDGAVLLFDELDNSLHTQLVRFLIRLFHNPEINRKHAQLVFSTHDVSLLDPDQFRRDQIWFVEKDKEQASHIYSLLEFNPRKGEAFEKGYLSGRYGALPVIRDFLQLWPNA